MVLARDTPFLSPPLLLQLQSVLHKIGHIKHNFTRLSCSQGCSSLPV